jgi:hypothetical protein
MSALVRAVDQREATVTDLREGAAAADSFSVLPTV